MRSVLWEESRDIGDKWSNPWCIAGYFNVGWFPSERIRDIRFTPTMGKFSDLIDERHLIVLPLGEKFLPDLIIMRNPPDLDRSFLVSTDWEEQFEKSIQSILTQNCVRLLFHPFRRWRSQTWQRSVQFKTCDSKLKDFGKRWSFGGKLSVWHLAMF